jgi:atypical dual specificity phosphatase
MEKDTEDRLEERLENLRVWNQKYFFDDDLYNKIQLVHQHKEDGVRIFIGGEGGASSSTELENNAITHVVSVRSTRYHQYKSFQGISYFRITNVDDCEDIKNATRFQEEHWPTACDFIQNANGNVLIHCQAGVSRSVALCAAYLIRDCNMKPGEAIATITTARPIASTQETFMVELTKWYKVLKFQKRRLRKLHVCFFPNNNLNEKGLHVKHCNSKCQ